MGSGVCVCAGLQDELADEEAAMNQIDANQLGRRNLHPHQIAVFRGNIYNRRKKAHGGDVKSEAARSKAQSEPLISTAELVAKETGVSPATIKRDGGRADDERDYFIEHRCFALTTQRRSGSLAPQWLSAKLPPHSPSRPASPQSVATTGPHPPPLTSPSHSHRSSRSSQRLHLPHRGSWKLVAIFHQFSSRLSSAFLAWPPGASPLPASAS